MPCILVCPCLPIHILQREPPVGVLRQWLGSAQGYPEVAGPRGPKNLSQGLPGESPRAVLEFTDTDTLPDLVVPKANYGQTLPLLSDLPRPDLDQRLLLELSLRGWTLPVWPISSHL